MKVLLTGAGGQLGQALQAIKGLDWEWLPIDREQVDFANPDALQTYLAKLDFQACIHTAAYTAVDKAESEPEIAHAVNALSSEVLARTCAQKQTPLVVVSTDYVYHTLDNNSPLRETQATNPKSVYARTKLQGEQLAQAAWPATYVVRTSWVYAPWGHNFVRTMLRLGAERPELRVVCDQIGSPTYAPDLADALVLLLQRSLAGQGPEAGIYHFSNEGVCSWYDFAHRSLQRAGLAAKVLPIPTSSYPTPAERPPFSLLDKTKIKEALQLEIRHWDEALADCLEALNK